MVLLVSNCQRHPKSSIDMACPDANLIDVKHSTHKNVKSFLKACAKEGLVKLKETKGDVVVTGKH